ncbi:MAG: trypsin-like peptidase domain-containing protein [candidate division SR1 bacterium]|nr:trypsin-like peptidase domain-containing protein [candidate division SR1 bacterium]
MEQKKYLGMSILVSVVVTFIGCIVVGFILRKPAPQVANPTPTVTMSDGFQSDVLTALSGAMSSIVSISANADIKSYVNDPSQVNGPTTVSGQVKLGGASGILVNKDGYVLTNKHAVENLQAHYQVRLADGHMYTATKIRLDPTLDLALLKIVDEKGNVPSNLSVATLLPFDQFASVGQFVLTIGNSLGDYPNAVTFGILSAQQKLLTINQKNMYTKLYQTDAHVSPGNSGGPLLDLQGRVIGIVSSVDATQHMTFALPLSSALIDTLIASIVQYGNIVKPLLGIEYLDITASLQAEKQLKLNAGVLVTSVLKDMPAAQGGLQNGDILMAIDDKPINLHFPLLYHLYTYIPNTTVTFTLMRNGQTMQIPVKLGQNGG